MNKTEAATLLTQTVIEKGILDLDTTHYVIHHEKAEEINKYNAKQIADFYTYVFETMCKADR